MAKKSRKIPEPKVGELVDTTQVLLTTPDREADLARASISAHRTTMIEGQGPAGDQAAWESATRRRDVVSSAVDRVVDTVGKLPPKRKRSVEEAIQIAVEEAFALGQATAFRIRSAYHGARRAGTRVDTSSKRAEILEALDKIPGSWEERFHKLSETNARGWTFAEIRYAKYPRKRRRPK